MVGNEAIVSADSGRVSVRAYAGRGKGLRAAAPSRRLHQMAPVAHGAALLLASSCDPRAMSAPRTSRPSHGLGPVRWCDPEVSPRRQARLTRWEA